MNNADINRHPKVTGLLYVPIILITTLLLIGCGRRVHVAEIENNKYEAIADFYEGQTYTLSIEVRSKNAQDSNWMYIYVDDGRSGNNAIMEFLRDDLLLARMVFWQHGVDEVWLFNLDNISPMPGRFGRGSEFAYPVSRKIVTDKYSIKIFDSISTPDVVLQYIAPFPIGVKSTLNVYFKDADSANMSMMPENIVRTEIYWSGGDKDTVYIDPTIKPDSLSTVGLSYEGLIRKRSGAL